MSTAKPQSMAGQSEAPDDLIAELARLMADEARPDTKPATKEPGPVRIPGEPDLGRAPVVPPVSAAPAQSSVRIPGGEPAMPAAASGRPADTEPFVFDFGLGQFDGNAGPSSPVPPVTPDPVPSPATPAAPAMATPPAPAPIEEAAELDHDSLADLIAAELAGDLDGEPEPQPIPELRGAMRDEDNFGVPPVFGLATTPHHAPAAPIRQPEPEPEIEVEAEIEPYAEPAYVDPVAEAIETVEAAPARVEPVRANTPLDDIERLVAPAVHLNAATANPAPTPSPALRSLATPTIPVPEKPAPVAQSQPASRVDVASVDEAILAAAAATGAKVDWVHAEPDETEPLPSADPEPRQRRRIGISRSVAGPLVAVGLLAVAGGGLFWMLGQGGGDAGPAPLLVADTTPVKEVPEADTASAQQSVVFNEMSGGNNGADEQIVSRDQADMDAVAAANAPAGSGVITDGAGTVVDPNQDGLVNRKVRTVTVRPDGTIVSGDDSVAGSNMLPVDRPNVPAVPGADTSTPDLIASAGADTPSALPATPVTPEPAPVAAAEPGTAIPVVNAAGTVIPGRSITVPMQKPSDFAQMASSALAAASVAPTQPAAPVAQPATQTPAASSGGNAAAYVQLASQRSEDAARQSAQAIATRYGVLFGGASLEIQRVDLGERGIYYRVLVPANSRESAANICTNVKAAGGDCFLL